MVAVPVSLAPLSAKHHTQILDFFHSLTVSPLSSSLSTTVSVPVLERKLRFWFLYFAMSDKSSTLRGYSQRTVQRLSVWLWPFPSWSVAWSKLYRAQNLTSTVVATPPKPKDDSPRINRLPWPFSLQIAFRFLLTRLTMRKALLRRKKNTVVATSPPEPEHDSPHIHRLPWPFSPQTALRFLLPRLTIRKALLRRKTSMEVVIFQPMPDK